MPEAWITVDGGSALCDDCADHVEQRKRELDAQREQARKAGGIGPRAGSWAGLGKGVDRDAGRVPVVCARCDLCRNHLDDVARAIEQVKIKVESEASRIGVKPADLVRLVREREGWS